MGAQHRAGHVEIGPKRVRVVFGGETIADTTAVRLVWEHPYYPTYYIPEADVRPDVLVDPGHGDDPQTPDEGRTRTVKVGDREAASAAHWFPDSTVAVLEGTIRFEWSAMDNWFEEDEEVYVHPRDPYKRLDVLQSSRHVRVEVDGVTVGESDKPRLLFETGLPTRHYLPKTDVRLDLLSPTSKVTGCPYKGNAQYYAIHVNGTVYENLAWWYQHPTLECAKIAGYVCFYDERVDTYVDGVRQQRPKTPFA